MLASLLFAASFTQVAQVVQLQPHEVSRKIVKDSPTGNYRAAADVAIAWNWNMTSSTTFTLSKVKGKEVEAIWTSKSTLNPTHLWVSKFGYVWALTRGLSGPGQVETMRVYDPRGEIIADWRLADLPLPAGSAGFKVPDHMSWTDLVPDHAKFDEWENGLVVVIRDRFNRPLCFQLDHLPDGGYKPRDPYIAFQGKSGG